MFAKSHPLYQDYQTLKNERDSLAAVFSENPQLYRSFLRVEKDETNVFKDYWGNPADNQDRFIALSIKQHAASYLQVQHKKAFEERLSIGEHESYQTVKSYKEAAIEAAALYQMLKQSANEALAS